MNAIHQYRYKLEYLLWLIRHRQLGTLQEAAKKLGCSERTVKYRVAQLRREGHLIVFDRQLKRYVWKGQRV